MADIQNGQGKDDESRSLWAGLFPVALFVCGAIVLGYACGHVGGSLVDPCPMAVGDFTKEGMLLGIAVGFVLGALLFYALILARKDK